LWQFTQRTMVIPWRRFGQPIGPMFMGQAAQEECPELLGPLRYDRVGPETSALNYHSTVAKIPEERRFHLRRGGGLKSKIPSGILPTS
jgi:hypothetical protein